MNQLSPVLGTATPAPEAKAVTDRRHQFPAPRLLLQALNPREAYSERPRKPTTAPSLDVSWGGKTNL